MRELDEDLEEKEYKTNGKLEENSLMSTITFISVTFENDEEDGEDELKNGIVDKSMDVEEDEMLLLEEMEE